MAMRMAAFVTAVVIFVPPASASEKYCRSGHPEIAVDLSTHVTPTFLARMAQLGVKAIIRYYDYPDETIRGKTLLPMERQKIAAAGFSLAVVFQHHNDRLSSFTKQRGHDDAARSLELAKANQQPPGSAIYFGVDGEWGRKQSEKEAILAYFVAAGDVVRASGYQIGVYGGGLVCQTLSEKSLTDYCWLANARSWPGYDELFVSKRWALLQTLPEDCGGINVDFDIIGTSKQYGQFH